jgi:fucose permease
VLLIGLGASCLAIAATRSFAILVVAVAANGLFGGVLDSLGNHFQTVLRNVGRAGLMFGAYGVGATLGPALVALTSWSTGYVAAGALALVAAWLAARPPVRWPASFEEREPPRQVAKQVRVPVPALAVLLSVFGIYCGIEVVTANWAASFLQDHRGTTSKVAGLAVSGFWAGMTLGRFALGLVRTTPNRMMAGAAVAVLVCYVGIATLPTPGVVMALVLGGAVLSAMFPTLMSTTADRVGVAAAGRVSGWELLAANVAATGLSAFAGVLVAWSSAGAPAVLMAGLAVIGLPVLLWSFQVHVGPPATDPAGNA